jgi:mutator protein MutT
LQRIQVAAGVIEREGRYLITRRPEGSHLAGCWEFPGGKRHPGESWEDCLRREVREELGIEVEVGPMLHETGHLYPDRRVRLRFYRCRVAAGAPAALGVAEFRWVRAEDLHRHDFPPADREVLSLLGAPPEAPGPGRARRGGEGGP